MPATNDELLAELQAIREAVEESNRVLAGKASRRSLLAVGFSVALSLAVGIGGIVYAAVERHQACVNGNVARAAIRDIGVELSIGDAEAIISVASSADTELVEQFRGEARRRAEAVVAQLEDREC